MNVWRDVLTRVRARESKKQRKRDPDEIIRVAFGCPVWLKNEWDLAIQMTGDSKQGLFRGFMRQYINNVMGKENEADKD